jgi:hypothetical protein
MIKWSKPNESFNYLCSSSLLEEMSDGSEKTENETIVCVIPKFVTPVQGCMCNSSTRPNGLPYSINVKLSTPITHNSNIQLQRSTSGVFPYYASMSSNSNYMAYINNRASYPSSLSNPPEFTIENRKWRGAHYEDFLYTNFRYEISRDLSASCNFSEFTLNNVYKYLERKFPSGEIFTVPDGFGFRDTVQNQTKCLWASLYGGVDYVLRHPAQYKCGYYSWDVQYPKVDVPDGFLVPSITWMYYYQVGAYNNGLQIGSQGGEAARPFWDNASSFPVPINAISTVPVTSTWSSQSDGDCLKNAGTCVPVPPWTSQEINAFQANPFNGKLAVRSQIYRSYGNPGGQAPFTVTINGQLQSGVLTGYPSYLFPRSAHTQEGSTSLFSRWINPSIPYSQAAQAIFDNGGTCIHPNQYGSIGPKFPNGQDSYWKEAAYYYDPVIVSTVTEGTYNNDPSNPLSSWYIWNNIFNNRSPKLTRTSTPQNNIYYHTDISLPRELVGPPTSPYATGIQFPVAYGAYTNTNATFQQVCSGCDTAFGDIGWNADGFPFGYYWQLQINNGTASLGLIGKVKSTHRKIYRDNYGNSTGNRGSLDTVGPRDGDKLSYPMSINYNGGNLPTQGSHRLPLEFVNILKDSSEANIEFDFGTLGNTFPFDQSTTQENQYGLYNPFANSISNTASLFSWLSYSGNPQIVPQIPCNFNGWWKMYRRKPPFDLSASLAPLSVGPPCGSGVTEPQFAYIYLGDSGA